MDYEKIKAFAYRARQDGICQAAAVAADYDRLSSHDYLVSECILGKLNIMKRKPRRNKAVRPYRSGVSCGELDRAMAAYWKNIMRVPSNPPRAVLEALKSFERDRRTPSGGGHKR